MKDVTVGSEHIHEARRRHGGYCVRGLDAWFTRHGMSLRVFLSDGYPASRLIATGDAFGIQVAKIAMEDDQ